MRSHRCWMTGVLALTVGLCSLPSSSRAEGGSPAGNGKCQAAPVEAATRPAPASGDGTAPGNAGSTGWTGGFGGSDIGTSQNGPTAGSTSTQPATAQGLDPIATAQKPGAGNC